MGRLGFPELLILLAIVFFLFGAKRLPEVGKGIGEGIRNFKNVMNKEEKGVREFKGPVGVPNLLLFLWWRSFGPRYRR